MTETAIPADLTLNARVIAVDARGEQHRGVATWGPTRDRDGVRGQFVKVWIRFDGRSDEIPWPIESVRVLRADELEA